jgi:hypothetical protein
VVQGSEAEHARDQVHHAQLGAPGAGESVRDVSNAWPVDRGGVDDLDDRENLVFNGFTFDRPATIGHEFQRVDRKVAWQALSAVY